MLGIQGDTARQGGEWTPSGCCSRTKYVLEVSFIRAGEVVGGGSRHMSGEIKRNWDGGREYRLQAAFQQRSNAADREECPLYPGFWI